jgi:DNA-binding NarL/FixJ family response regulator
MGDRIRVVLADDHAVVRKGIKQFLEEAGDITVVAEASDGAEALRLVEAHQPDVAVVDIRMPEVTGVEATRRIKERFPQVRVLVLTAYDDDPYVFALLQAGADGYVLKTASGDELVRAVRIVHQGGTALSPEIAAKVVRQATSHRPEGAADQVETLTTSQPPHRAGAPAEHIRQAGREQPHRGSHRGAATRLDRDRVSRPPVLPQHLEYLREYLHGSLVT